jgi:hypothetical protein
MLTPEERMHARRVFEETLRKYQRLYAPSQDVVVEATMLDDAEQTVVVARYKIYVDGHIACFQVLDEVLWPSR